MVKSKPLKYNSLSKPQTLFLSTKADRNKKCKLKTNSLPNKPCCYLFTPTKRAGFDIIVKLYEEKNYLLRVSH